MGSDALTDVLASTSQWDAADYARVGGFVPALGQAALELLNPRPGEAILDVGCGDARLLTELILRIADAELYVGLDPRRDAVPAHVRANEPRLSVVRAAAEALPLPDASFDLVLASM